MIQEIVTYCLQKHWFIALNVFYIKFVSVFNYFSI